jgi:hypothetical protein
VVVARSAAEELIADIPLEEGGEVAQAGIML